MRAFDLHLGAQDPRRHQARPLQPSGVAATRVRSSGGAQLCRRGPPEEQRLWDSPHHTGVLPVLGLALNASRKPAFHSPHPQAQGRDQSGTGTDTQAVTPCPRLLALGQAEPSTSQKGLGRTHSWF